MTNITYYPKDNRIGFNRTRRGGEFSAEASSLFGPGQVPTEFTLTVQATGNQKTFTGSRVVRDADNDITEFVYTAPGGFRFTVFND